MDVSIKQETSSKVEDPEISSPKDKKKEKKEKKKKKKKEKQDAENKSSTMVEDVSRTIKLIFIIIY